MTVKLYALTCGHLTGSLKHLMEGGEGDVRLPIPSYLIEHPKGLALYDSGMHPQCQTAPAARVGERLAGIFKFEYAPGEEVSAKLEAMDRDPGRIDYLINSHLHFDHAGGNELIPNASLVVQRAEFEVGRDAEQAQRYGFNPSEVNAGHPVIAPDGEYDVFGDGSVVCLPTPGHTPGHQSLLVRLEGGDVVLAGDSCYFCRTLRERRLPRFAHDREQMYASLDKLAALEASGARIFFGHDPEFWATVPQGPTPITF